MQPVITFQFCQSIQFTHFLLQFLINSLCSFLLLKIFQSSRKKSSILKERFRIGFLDEVERIGMCHSLPPLDNQVNYCKADTISLI